MLTIRDVFALLYPGADRLAQLSPRASAAKRKKVAATLEFPMWFPDPAASPDPQPATLVHEAQTRLMRQIQTSIPKWQKNLEALYAEGYRDSGESPGIVPRLPMQLDPIVHLPARTPYDVFLIAGYLLDHSGAYHHIQPDRELHPARCGHDEHSEAIDPVRHLAITREDRDLVISAAKAWRDIPWRFILPKNMQALAEHLTRRSIWPCIAPLFESWLVVFGAYSDRAVFHRRPADERSAYPPPGWWFHAWRLFAIADEAAKGTGFLMEADLLSEMDKEDPDRLPWFERFLWLAALNNYSRLEQQGENDSFQMSMTETFAFGRREIACVMPKVRTPSIGCTLRSLSHHLALLPSNGVARAKWLPAIVQSPEKPQAGDPGGDTPTPRPNDQMNLLLIPFPYSLDAKAFCGSILEKPPEGRQAAFGYFDVHQDWLTASKARREELVTLVNDLVLQAKTQANDLHGVIFPELALDMEAYEMVRAHLEKIAPEIQMFISGVSRNSKNRKGNFVAVTTFHDGENERGEVVRERLARTVRDKHHRWKLDTQQLRGYGLTGVLEPEVAWWENIDLLSRRVDFASIRKDLVVSALICEDLARVDPCQLLLRAVAPHLVIALLMDAPQVTTRWPARYATVLAEDPGCAVLTLTSRALMARQHRIGVHRSSGTDRYVALWRDDPESEAKPIHCPHDSQAVLLTVAKRHATDISLDGREDSGAQAWRYAGHVPVRIPAARLKFAQLLGDDDLAGWELV